MFIEGNYYLLLLKKFVKIIYKNNLLLNFIKNNNLLN